MFETDFNPEHSPLWFLFTPYFIPLLDLCVLGFPSALDIEHSQYGSFALYLVAGFIDYIALSMLSIVIRLFRSEWTTFLTGTLFFLGGVFRSWRLGGPRLLRLCRVDWSKWSEVRRVNMALLLLNPALFWLAVLSSFSWLFSIDVSGSWVPMISWTVATANLEGGKLADLTSKNPIGLDKTFLPKPTSWVTRTIRSEIVHWVSSFILRNIATVLLTLVAALVRWLPNLHKAIKAVIHSPKFEVLGPRLQSIDATAALWRDRLVMEFLRMAAFILKRDMIEPFLIGFDIGPGVHRLEIYTSYAIRQSRPFLSNVGQRLRSYYSKYVQQPTVPQLVKDTPVTRPFRVLKVYPSLYQGGTVRCTLENVDLSEPPSYIAVSYVWGDPKRAKEIIVDGRTKNITASAFDVIKGLRSRWRMKNLWIDQLCIDQDDPADKIKQLPLMAHIYSKASGVVVWLGSAPDADVAISLIQRIWLNARLTPALGLSLELPLSSSAPWQALRKLLRHPWFERTWIVQEVAIKSDIFGTSYTMHYGGASLNWKNFTWFTFAVVSDISKAVSSIAAYDEVCTAHILNARMIAELSWFTEIDEPRPVSLLYFLVRMSRLNCHFEATISKDKIYAILHLAKVAELPLFAPDYLKSDNELFIDVAGHFLSSSPPAQRLNFLAHAGSSQGSNLSNLPSWVPDWSRTPDAYPFIGLDGTAEILDEQHKWRVAWQLAQLQSYEENSFTHADFRPKFKAAQSKLEKMMNDVGKVLYRASGDTAPDAEILPGHVLKVWGYRFDRIKRMGSPWRVVKQTSWPWRFAPCSAVLAEWMRIAAEESSTSPYTVQERGPVALARTRRGNFDKTWFEFMDSRAPSRLGDDPGTALMMSYLSSTTASGGQTGSGQTDRGSADVPLRNRISPSQFDSGERRFLFEGGDYNEHIVCAGRAFGVSERGYFGMLPQGTKEGDWIVLFEGASVPYVLKEDEDGIKHVLVGPAYVHGIMDGEHLRTNPVRKDFCLR